MGIESYAKLIPADVRRLRLLTDADPIAHANTVTSDPRMMLLAEVWYTYIEPNKARSYCPVCLENIRSSMRAIKPFLIQLETASQSLAQL